MGCVACHWAQNDCSACAPTADQSRGSGHYRSWRLPGGEAGARGGEGQSPPYNRRGRTARPLHNRSCRQLSGVATSGDVALAVASARGRRRAPTPLITTDPGCAAGCSFDDRFRTDRLIWCTLHAVAAASCTGATMCTVGSRSVAHLPREPQRALSRLGADVRDLAVGPPATEAQVLALEAELAIQLPASLRRASSARGPAALRPRPDRPCSDWQWLPFVHLRPARSGAHWWT